MKIKCANPGCRHSAHTLTIKMGLHIKGKQDEKLWFCSQRCYKNFSADQLIIEKRGGLRKTVSRAKLGYLLVKNQLIRKEQLTAALETKSGSLKRLGEVLLESGQLTEKELKAALSMQSGVAPITLDPGTKVKMKDEIPFKLIDEFHFVIFKRDEDVHTAAVAVYDMDTISYLEDFFSKIYPDYTLSYYLESKKKILDIISHNYPEEKLNLKLEEQMIPPGPGSNLEQTTLRLVEFLNKHSGRQVKIDSLDNAVWIKAETDQLKIDVYLTPKSQDSNLLKEILKETQPTARLEP